MTLRRGASIGAALVVAAIAAYVSYRHMRHLALQHGQDGAAASVLPLSVDGMLVVATLAIGDGRRYRWSAWLAFWIGVLISVVANTLAAPPHVLDRAISAWPAVAFLLTVEVITRGGRGTRVTAAPPTPPPLPVEADEPQVSAPILDPPPVPIDPINGVRAGRPKPKTDAQLLAALRQPKRVPRDPDGTVPITRAVKLLGCGPDRARRLLDQAGLLATEALPDGADA